MVPSVDFAFESIINGDIESGWGERIMAKFRSRTLRWKTVDSKDVVGYKIYWSKGNKVTYDSKSVYVQNLTEIVIPNALEGFVPERGIYMFGVTAIDQWGNESDLTLLKEPFQFSSPSAPELLWVDAIGVPSAPDSIWLETIDNKVAGDRKKGRSDKNTGNFESQFLRPSENNPSQQSVKYYDDVGFRKI